MFSPYTILLRTIPLEPRLKCKFVTSTLQRVCHTYWNKICDVQQQLNTDGTSRSFLGMLPSVFFLLILCCSSSLIQYIAITILVARKPMNKPHQRDFSFYCLSGSHLLWGHPPQLAPRSVTPTRTKKTERENQNKRKRGKKCREVESEGNERGRGVRVAEWFTLAARVRV